MAILWLGVGSAVVFINGIVMAWMWADHNRECVRVERLWNLTGSKYTGGNKMPETTEKMKLSDAITKGISMRPKRAQGVYFAGDNRSDVLGAAFQGLKGTTDVHNYQVEGELEAAFPLLKKKVMNPETGELKTLKTVIRQLNDKHLWKRKNVARFVRSVEGRQTLVHNS